MGLPDFIRATTNQLRVNCGFSCRVGIAHRFCPTNQLRVPSLLTAEGEDPDLLLWGLDSSRPHTQREGTYNRSALPLRPRFYSGVMSLLLGELEGRIILQHRQYLLCE